MVYTWYSYPKALSNDAVDRILKIGDSEWKAAKIGGGTKSIENKLRKTDLIWNNEQWLYDLVWPFMLNANKKSNWNFEVDCAESFQLGRYQDGGHYDFHMDGNLLMPDPNFNGKTRKISLVIWLNEDFEGGEFEFHSSVTHDDKRKMKPSKGTILFFPSHLPHKVHPVTKGIRYSLVTWFYGQPVR